MGEPRIERSGASFCVRHEERSVPEMFCSEVKNVLHIDHKIWYHVYAEVLCSQRS